MMKEHAIYSPIFELKKEQKEVLYLSRTELFTGKQR